MSFINKLFVRFLSDKIGEDEFGNEYRISFLKNYLGKNKRFIIYNGLDLSSRVPPVWHAWLHYLNDEIPVTERKKLSWQKNYEPNLTGTKFAYNPSSSVNKFSVYNKWEL